ncbi:MULTISPECIES: hypothetical protein [unclassified Yoonia]|uniref:hypothetical protein n=1 Tax=unclassified Yoonia TaxID=2629118 RepID=UPI002AFEC7C8|nr:MULTISPECIES: hypothetical protein [unclassified Yoonia]
MPATRRNVLALAGAGIWTGRFAVTQESGVPDGALHILTRHVTGTDRDEAPLRAGQLAVGRPLRLHCEPHNGYIPRVYHQAAAHLIDAGKAAFAHIAAVRGERWRPETGVGVVAALET